MLDTRTLSNGTEKLWEKGGGWALGLFLRFPVSVCSSLAPAPEGLHVCGMPGAGQRTRLALGGAKAGGFGEERPEGSSRSVSVANVPKVPKAAELSWMRAPLLPSAGRRILLF